MDKRNADTMLLDDLPFREGDGQATFIGIDWCRRKDWTGATCPRCQQPHRWRTRIPKRCRHCGLKFYYTASIAR